MAMIDPTRQSGVSSILVELQNEYRQRTIVFYVVFSSLVLMHVIGSSPLGPIGMILLFAIVVDLLSIRRSVRICRVLAAGTTGTE